MPDRIAVTPHVRGDRKWVDWHGSMELAPIVSGITPALGDALSMDERWWPQRDSTGQRVCLKSTSRGPRWPHSPPDSAAVAFLSQWELTSLSDCWRTPRSGAGPRLEPNGLQQLAHAGGDDAVKLAGVGGHVTQRSLGRERATVAVAIAHF